jgi:hypothetical protein
VDEGYSAHPSSGGGRFAVREQGPFHRPEKQPQYRSRQGRIAVQVPAQPLGQRQDPLAHRYRRDHIIHQVGRGLGNCSCIALGNRSCVALPSHVLVFVAPASLQSSTIRRVLHDGQMPRPLQLNGLWYAAVGEDQDASIGREGNKLWSSK